MPLPSSLHGFYDQISSNSYWRSFAYDRFLLQLLRVCLLFLSLVMCLSLYFWVYPSWSLLNFLDIFLSIMSSNVSNVWASSRILFVEYSFFNIVYGLQFFVSLYVQFKRKNKSMRHLKEMWQLWKPGSPLRPGFVVVYLSSDFTEFSAQVN